MNSKPIPILKDPFAFLQPGLVRFNPAQANAVFETMRYEFNRKEQKARQHIAALARMMRSGAWRSGSVIEFTRLPSGKTTLLDGHHRMLAQVDAGVDITWNVVIRDVKDTEEIRSLWWTFDTTLRKRSISNILDGVNAAEALGLSKVFAAKLASAVQFSDNGFAATQGPASRTYTPGEVLHLVQAWQPEAAVFEALTASAPKLVKRKLYSAQVMAVALVTLRAQPATAETFWRGIAEDDGLRRGDPRKALLDYLRDMHLASGGYTTTAAAAARAWAAWVGAREINFIRVGMNPVVIAGTKLVVKP